MREFQLVVRYRWVVVAVVCMLASAPLAAEGDSTGNPATALVDRTDAGTFVGTWLWGSRDSRIAIWIREDAGSLPELKLRYSSLAAHEEFETDWTGSSTYYVSGQQAQFRIEIQDKDRDAIRGTWNWELQFARTGRSEKGAFTLYRTLDGRQMVMDFSEFERVVRRGERVKTYQPDYAMTFSKASKRLVTWEELPL